MRLYFLLRFSWSHRFLRWCHFPTVTLLVLLQRTPLLRLLVAGDEFAIATPATDLLKIGVASAAALGAIDSMAGATVITPSQSSPLNGQVGNSVSVAFGITGGLPNLLAGSWQITISSGSLPAGLVFSDKSQVGAGQNIGSGILDPASTLYLKGTPTVAGVCTVSLKAWENSGQKGAVSPVLSYTINVSAGSSPPAITSSPASQTVATGTTVVFSVGASGASTYQWKFNGAAISGATAANYILSGATSANAGSYTVTVSNAAGSVTSSAVTLTVLATSDPGRLINLSVNTLAGPGSDLLTLGFVSGGAGTSGNFSILARAAGPSLVPLGVPNVLPDPVITLLSGSTAVATNNDWGGDAQLTNVGAQLGAFPFSSASSKDAALIAPLSPQPYTIQVVGNGASGNAVAEVYDTRTSFVPGASRLINLSVNSSLTSARTVLTAGFVIGGSTSCTVLIRAVGPKLVDFHVPNPLANPQLELFHTAGGTSVSLVKNDDWGNDPQITATSVQVGAFALDAGSKDAVILTTLPPGNYTAQATSVDSGSGTVLVEVYEVH